jgi:hypothetical protein
MCLIAVFTSKPTRTSIGLDWNDFCESNWNLFENAQERTIFRNLFFSNKMMGLWFVYCNYYLIMNMQGVYELKLGFTLKMTFLLKKGKMRRT